MWRGEVVAAFQTELQEFLGHLGTHYVGTQIVPAGPAEPVAEEAGHGLAAAYRQRFTQYIAAA
jgi:hypothetical protein